MELKDQVCSLELAKRLKELGVRTPSVFTWVESTGKNQTYDDGTVDGEYKLTDFSGRVSNYHARGYESDLHAMFHAFTVAELGEMLMSSDYYLPYTNTDWSMWECRVGNTPDGEKQYIQAKTEADCRAHMLIFLLENNLISLPA